ncbi:MAG TPA: glycosyltransferase [Gemmatimonadetes bacterium]|nr:glycosyltransferase [Gemmatimonadota bacterium]
MCAAKPKSTAGLLGWFRVRTGWTRHWGVEALGAAMTQRKVLVVTFVDLVDGAGGPARAAVAVARRLHEEGRLVGIVSPSADPEAVGLPRALLYSPPHPLVHRVIQRILSFPSQLSDSTLRRLRETLFDFFLSRSGIMRHSDTVLFLKPAFPRSADRASKAGIQSWVWASILHPHFNRDRILEEREKWRVTGGQAYTDPRRITALERFFSRVDHILVGSSLARRSYLDHGIPEGSVSLLEQTFAIDLRAFEPPMAPHEGEIFRVLHVSQMNLIKGIGYLLTAWSKLRLDSAELVLVGSMEPGIIDLCERLAPPSTRVTGFTRNVARHYAEADVFVSPSAADLHPYTVLEAMASGIPVIVSNQCGISAAVDHGRNGFVYPHDDCEALAGHIRWCQDNPIELRKMGLAAREKARNFDQENFAENLIRAIDEAPG